MSEKGPFPRLADETPPDRRPPKELTYQLAALHPGSWVLDSTWNDERRAMNRRHYLRRWRPRPADGTRYAVRLFYRGEGWWDVLVALLPERDLEVLS
jgi:hypothetical protein